MVERPIKKSERLARAATEGEIAATQPSESQEPRSDRGRDRKGGKGKGRGKGDRREDAKPPINPALMRGPKPTKPKEVVEEPVVEAPVEVGEGEEATTDTAVLNEAATEPIETELPVA